MNVFVEFGIYEPRDRGKFSVPAALQLFLVEAVFEPCDFLSRKVGIIVPFHKFVPYFAVAVSVEKNLLIDEGQAF